MLRSLQLEISKLAPLEQIGNGQFGTVYKTAHVSTEKEIAVKKTPCTRKRYEDLCKLWKFMLDEEFPASHSEGRKHIVQFYGTIYFDGDCWFCMELMDLSMDKVINSVYSEPGECIPEFVIAQVARAIVLALQFIELNFTRSKTRNKSRASNLRETPTAPFADIKTSNILVNRSGQIKLCNLGMCRRLGVPSTTSLDGKWCHYISPERICPSFDSVNGDVESCIKADVWAVGVSLYEISAGVLPFQDLIQTFQIVSAIVNDPAPELKVTDSCSGALVNFVNSCLRKDARDRPSYEMLLRHDFLLKVENQADAGEFFSNVITRHSANAKSVEDDPFRRRVFTH